MTNFISAFAPRLEAMLLYRETLGFSRHTREYCLKSFDRFCSEYYPELESLSKGVVLKWLEIQGESTPWALNDRAIMIRHLGKYLISIKNDAYVLPSNFVSVKSSFTPYILTDTELTSFFHAADTLIPTKRNPFAPEIAPVLFRLIYTCGLRPNEGRVLKRANINFYSGEILVTGTKRKKERVVVMSDDMLALCKQYDMRRTIVAADSEFFFPWQNGGAFTTNQLISLFKKCWTQANPETDISKLPRLRVYDLRHRFASAVLNKWLDEGRNLYAMLPFLSAYMGHSSLSATAYYIHLLPENLVKSAGIDWRSFDRLIPEVSKWQG